jgi:HlyD family type I secretion membrane fusion protein
MNHAVAPEPDAVALASKPLPRGAGTDAGHDGSLRKYTLAGWAIIFAFFGLFGTWALVAPLNGAVVSPGIVKVEGNRKSVQHLDGGIVKELRVKEGDHVQAGEVLAVLDDSQARAEYEVLSQRQTVLRATELRLTAEMNKAPTLLPSPDIAARLNEPDVRNIWTAQLQQFESRRAALEGKRQVLREKINQLTAQVGGSERQAAAYKRQITSVRQELENIKPLVEQGLIARPRRLQLERIAYGLDGQIGAATADAARARQAIAEQSQNILQLDNDREAEITKELRDTQAQRLEVTPKLERAKTALGRTEIRAPYAGTVVGLAVFGIGAVIEPGEKLLDIVPDDDALMIETRIAVDDISDVHPNLRADILLTAYKQRITPMVHGDVIQVSADRLTDGHTGIPYYTALIRVDQKELANIPHVQLYPGMPAEVMIPTVQRTAFDYIIGPFASSLNTAFRQR